MDIELLRHASEAYKALLAAEHRARLLTGSPSRKPPKREMELLEIATTAMHNFMASPHEERD